MKICGIATQIYHPVWNPFCLPLVPMKGYFWCWKACLHVTAENHSPLAQGPVLHIPHHTVNHQAHHHNYFLDLSSVIRLDSVSTTHSPLRYLVPVSSKASNLWSWSVITQGVNSTSAQVLMLQHYGESHAILLLPEYKNGAISASDKKMSNTCITRFQHLPFGGFWKCGCTYAQGSYSTGNSLRSSPSYTDASPIQSLVLPFTSCETLCYFTFLCLSFLTSVLTC